MFCLSSKFSPPQMSKPESYVPATVSMNLLEKVNQCWLFVLGFDHFRDPDTISDLQETLTKSFEEGLVNCKQTPGHGWAEKKSSLVGKDIFGMFYKDKA